MKRSSQKKQKTEKVHILTVRFNEDETPKQDYKHKEKQQGTKSNTQDTVLGFVRPAGWPIVQMKQLCGLAERPVTETL